MKSVTFTFLFALIFTFGNSQSYSPLTNGRVIHLDTPSIIDKRNGPNFHGILNVNNDHTFKEKYHRHGKVKSKHTKYQQYYKGIKVLGGTVILHEKDHALVKISGDLFSGQEINPNPNLSSVDARGAGIRGFRNIAQLDYQEKATQLKNPQPTEVNLMIVKSNLSKRNSLYVLAYEVKIESSLDNHPVSYNIYVDANTGDFLHGHSTIVHNTVEGHGDGFHYKDVHFETDSLGPNEYVLQDLSRGEGVFAYDFRNNFQEFVDDDNEWNYESVSEQSTIDAYYGAQTFYDFLRDKFNRNSLDDDGFPLVVHTNYKLFGNAFWNGDVATFGSGDCNQFNPLTTMEIVSHEFTHGLTQFTSNLIYRNESGALNEAISDIFGKGMEFYYDNENFNWKIGQRVFKESLTTVIRSMSDPNEEGDPKYYQGVNWKEPDGFDNGGVHSNSGVLNHWFYLLVNGGSGVNEAGVQYDVEPIDMQDALDIVYQVETAYLTENSGYLDAFIYTFEAAEDLFGIPSSGLESVREAWKAVGIDENTIGGGDEVVIDMYYNNLPPGQGELCASTFDNLSISFVNDGNTILPSGSELSVISIMDYTTTVNGNVMMFSDIFEFNIVLSEDLQPFGSVEEFISHEFPEDLPTTVRFNTNVDISLPNGESDFKAFEDNLRLNSRIVPELGFTFAQPIDICNSSDGFNFISINIDLPQCEDLTGTSLEFTLDTGDDILTATAMLPEDDFTFDYNIFSLESVFSDPIPTDLSSAKFTISYSDGTDLTEITEVNLGEYFAKPLTLGEVITFDQPLEFNDHVVIDECFFCDVFIENQELYLFSASFNDELQDCEAPEEVILSSSNSFFAPASTATVCVDYDGIVDPKITYDTRLEDGFDGPSADDPYRRALIITQNENPSIDDLFIFDTQDAFESFENQLEPSKGNRVTFTAYTDNQGVRLDNIALESGVVSTTEVNLGQIKYNNPVSDQMFVLSEVSGSISIIDANGRLIRTDGLILGANTVNMTNIPSGMYFFKVVTQDDKVYSGKVIRM